MAIIISKDRVSGTHIISSKFILPKELILQKFILGHPEALPVYDINKDKLAALVALCHPYHSLSPRGIHPLGPLG